MIHFNCPHCDKAIRVRDETAGRKGKCLGCGETIQVPQNSLRIASPTTTEMPNAISLDKGEGGSMIKSVVREWDEEEQEWVLADTQWDEEEQEWVPLAEWEPEGLVDMLLGEDEDESDEEESVENVFCPTGPGGGVDASCSPGKAGGAHAAAAVSGGAHIADGGDGIKHLPQDHGKYFKKEVAAKAKYAEVPIDSLQAIRAREDGIKNANGFMRDAYDGKGSPREPISVIKDGSISMAEKAVYKISDGVILRGHSQDRPLLAWIGNEWKTYPGITSDWLYDAVAATPQEIKDAGIDESDANFR